MGLSVASLFGYRSGSIKISNKAWGKLEQCEADLGAAAEAEAGIDQDKASDPEADEEHQPSEITMISGRLERVELLLEELLAEFRGKDRPTTSYKVRGKKI